MTILIETVSDTALVFLCCEFLFRDRHGRKPYDLILLPVTFLFCMAARTNIDVGAKVSVSLMKQGFELFPANNLFMLIFFILALLLMNSVYYKPQDNSFSFCGSMAAVSVYLLSRLLGIAVFSLLGTAGNTLLTGSRLLSLLFAAGFFLCPLSDYIRQAVRNGGFLAVLVSANITVLLAAVLSLAAFDYSRIAERLWQIAAALAVLLAADGILLAVNQRRLREQKHVRMIEQYVPIVEELVSQVRLRQHEFNNRMFAMEAAVFSADSLEEAQRAVAGLKSGILLDNRERELLVCDSKIIAGLLYEKSRQAEAAGIAIQIELNGQFKKSTTPETEWIELLGILTDNAIEASHSGDTIYIRSRSHENLLEVCISNPAPPMTNTEFRKLFRRGVTTKTDGQSHGFGLYQVSCTVERRHGKIIVKNEGTEEQNFVVFGVLLP